MDENSEVASNSTGTISVNKSEKNIVKKAVKVGKPKVYYVPVHRVPRLLKRDARRDYGTMLMNVLNSQDDLLISKFVQKLHTPDCVYSASIPDAVQFNERPNIAAAGIVATINEIIFAVQGFPDFIIEMKECQILRQESVKSSRIAIMSGLKGTKLFVPARMTYQTSTSNFMPSPMMFLSQTMTPKDGMMTNVLTTAPPVIPMSVQCSLHIVMTLDECNMIQAVEVVASDSVTVPLHQI